MNVETKSSRKQAIEAYKSRAVIGGIYVIKNAVNGKSLLLCAENLEGAKNRFAFSQSTGSCLHTRLMNDYSLHGNEAFSLEVLEELKKKETQTDAEFKADLEVLLELRKQKFNEDELY